MPSARRLDRRARPSSPFARRRHALGELGTDLFGRGRRHRFRTSLACRELRDAVQCARHPFFRGETRRRAREPTPCCRRGRLCRAGGPFRVGHARVDRAHPADEVAGRLRRSRDHRGRCRLPGRLRLAAGCTALHRPGSPSLTKPTSAPRHPSPGAHRPPGALPPPSHPGNRSRTRPATPASGESPPASAPRTDRPARQGRSLRTADPAGSTGARVCRAPAPPPRLRAAQPARTRRTTARTAQPGRQALAQGCTATSWTGAAIASAPKITTAFGRRNRA